MLMCSPHKIARTSITAWATSYIDWMHKLISLKFQILKLVVGFCIPLRLVKLNHRGTEHYKWWLSWNMWVTLPTLRASTKGKLSGGGCVSLDTVLARLAWGPEFASPEPMEKAGLAWHPASHPSGNQRRLSRERACLSKSCSPTT